MCRTLGRGGSMNSLSVCVCGGGGGFWARILRGGGGLGSRSVGIFIYWQAKKNGATAWGAPFTPPWGHIKTNWLGRNWKQSRQLFVSLYCGNFLARLRQGILMLISFIPKSRKSLTDTLHGLAYEVAALTLDHQWRKLNISIYPSLMTSESSSRWGVCGRLTVGRLTPPIV